MKDSIPSLLLKATQAHEVKELGVLQKLWSGYGSIVRYQLRGAEVSSVIVKHVSPPTAADHPRGWNTDISHQRKLKSYAVETAWYRDYANRCEEACRVPHCFTVHNEGEEVVMVLEDLDAAGFPLRQTSVTECELAACVSWLGNFHATFLGVVPDGLWERGSYWHLETRPDELQVLAQEDPKLCAAAEAIDARLKASPYQTLIHGDAKLANFCFSQEGQSVAAVDFQYIGSGIGVQDLAYFLGSCLREDDCAAAEQDLLDLYFTALREASYRRDCGVDVDALEADWRALYPVAWTDFHRFLKGWSPGHWKINSYSERLAQAVLAQLKEEGL
ncbi:phosphotransferase [Coraliomargarita sp. W4R53]